MENTRTPAPTPNAPAGELTADEALFARILDLRHWTSSGTEKRHVCKCEDCKAIKQVVHLARQAVATSQSKRAKQLAEMESALLAARREVERYRALKLALGVDCRVVAYGNPPKTVTNLDVFADDLISAALAATPEEKR